MPKKKRSAATALQAFDSVVENPIEHKQIRVLTLDLIDQLHGRPKGTAGRAFRKLKDRRRSDRRKLLRIKHHYFVVKRGSVSDCERPSTQSVDASRSQGSGLILITQPGYLMLVKTFQDDLAWEIQERLVDNYFVDPSCAPGVKELASAVRHLEQRTDELQAEVARKSMERKLFELRARVVEAKYFRALNMVSERVSKQAALLSNWGHYLKPDFLKLKPDFENHPLFGDSPAKALRQKLKALEAELDDLALREQINGAGE